MFVYYAFTNRLGQVVKVLALMVVTKENLFHDPT